VAIVLVLAHLACGNIVSVFQPHRTEPRSFSSGGDLVTTLASLLVASIPGALVIELLRSDVPDFALKTLAIAAIVLLTMAAYAIALRYAGTSLERRIESIRTRLA
jgi:hypothetical protein